MKYKKLRTPIKILGGKGNFRKKILVLMPKHTHYVEVFGGGASVLLGKRPVENGVEVYNDINEDLYNFFKILRDNFDELYRLIKLTPYSRVDFNKAREKWKNCDYKNDIDRAYMFYILGRMCFGGISCKTSWGSSISTTCRNISAPVSAYISNIEMLPEIYNRLITVQIDCADFRNLIKRYNEKDTLLYLDPPYLSDKRQVDTKYKYEMSFQDHENLLDICLNYSEMIMLSGYNNDLYNNRLKKFIKYEFTTSCYQVAKTRITNKKGKNIINKNHKRIECLWLNQKAYKKLISKGKYI